jgi:hypothetical protein
VKGRPLWILIAAFLFVLSFVVPTLRAAKRGELCLTRLQSLGVSMLLYTMDHDDRLPPTAVWADAVKAGGADPVAFRCPCLDGGLYGHAFASAMGGAQVGALVEPAKAPLVFDSNDPSWNASGDPRRMLPAGGRYGNDLSGVVFADGSARAVRRSDLGPLNLGLN